MKAVRIIFGLCLAFAVLGTLAQAQIAIEGAGDSLSQAKPGVAVPPPTTPGNHNKDILEFLNGDVLHGEFLSIDAKNEIHWQHPAMKEPIEITPSSVARIKLERPNTPANANARQSCRVRLTNHDELFGQLVGLDEEKLQLDTWYGGALSIPRKMIEAIAPGQGQSAYIYEGPTGMEGWTARGNRMIIRQIGGGLVGTPGNGEAWSYGNGAFSSGGNGSLGHSFNFPSKVNIEFDLSWRGYLLLAISLFSDSLESYGANSYLLQFNQNNVYLQRMSNVGNSAPLANTDVAVFAQKNQAHISIRADKEQKTVSLVVDGAPIKQWTEQGDLPNGPNLVFHQQGQGFTKISGMKITAWDGKFETQGGDRKTKEDLVKLINGDNISGALKNIQNGKMSFQTPFAALEVPVERIAQLELAGEKSERAPQQPGDVRLNFLDHGSICLRLDQWDGRQITGRSPNLGQVKLNPSAFAEMQFNLDKKKAEPEADAMGGLGNDNDE